MAGIRKKPHASGRFQAWFKDLRGRRKFFTGTRSHSETLRMARSLEDQHTQVRLGYRPEPKPAARHGSRNFAAVVQEYLDWGSAQGGRYGKPWGEGHARMRRTHLSWWSERLGLGTLSDLDGMLPKMEKALRDLFAAGRTGKTVQNHAEALKAFGRWCLERGYLAEDPLSNFKPFDISPHSERRAMTPEEIRLLLDAAPLHRRMAYEVALFSGLRARELRSLTVADLNMDFEGLNLRADWTKNRKPGFQPLPPQLLNRLKDSAQEKQRDEALLYVPVNTSRDFDKDLQAARIAKWRPEGKLDFHALRVTYVSLLIESGATVKEVQALARHGTADLTFNVYGKTKPQRLAKLAEDIRDKALFEEERAHSVQRKAVGAEASFASPLPVNGLEQYENGGGGGSRTRVTRFS